MVSSAIAEGEQMRAERVERQLFLDENRQAPYLLAKVDDVAAQVDAHLIARADHGCPRSASSNRRVS